MKLKALLYISGLSTLLASTAFGDINIMEGTVSNIRPGFIAISKWGGDQEIDFMIEPNSWIQETESLDDLTFGDQVKIYYENEGKRKIVTTIIKERSDQMETEL